VSKNFNSNPSNWFDNFVKAYIVCALWSSTNEGDQATSENLDGQYDGDDIEPATYFDMVADCAQFATMMLEALTTEELEEADAAQYGHDFWLTRNGHGAGFWDRRELEANELGERLTKLSKEFPEYDLVGDGERVSKL